jgi:hypothetical protein
MTRVHGKPNKERKIKHMKNRNNIFTTTLVALAFALALGAEASPAPDGGPTYLFSTASSNGNSENDEAEDLPMITIHSTDNVLRGKTGSFVLNMRSALDTKPAFMSGGRYVNFKVSGTAIAGVDYVLLVSPAYIGKSGYGVIQVKTLPDQRGSSFRQAYSVVVTLEAGAGYEVGAARSATMWIKP